MKKTYGVCFGMLAMGLAVFGAPAIRAAGGNDASTESTTAAATTPVASSPADLDHRIEALEMELSELRTELAAKKTEEPVAGVQAAAPATDAAKPPDKVTVASLLGPTSVSGFFDVYYNYDTNHPSSKIIPLAHLIAGIIRFP